MKNIIIIMLAICITISLSGCVFIFNFGDINYYGEPPNYNKSSPEESISAPNLNFDFRNTIWGMSRKEVMNSEYGKLLETSQEEKNLLPSYSDILAYSDDTFGKESKIIYYFEHDKLIMSGVEFIKKYNDVREQYLDYLEIFDSYTFKYGETSDFMFEPPVEDDYFVCMGTWKYNNTTIYLSFVGGLESNMVVTHISSDYLDNIQKEETKDNKIYYI